MKAVRFPAAAALVLAVGCAGTETQQPETLDDRFTKLEVQITQKLDKAHAVYTELIEKTLLADRRLAKLENDLAALQVDMKRLTERFEQGLAQRGSGPAPAPDSAEVGNKIDLALAKLKTTGNVDEAFRDLLPIARYSVPRLADALKQVGETHYVTSVEKTLAKFPVAELKGPMEDAAKDRLRRTSVARVVASTGDKGMSKILEGYAGDSDPVIQIELGEALLMCKNKMGIPPLLSALGAAEPEIRIRAFFSLKRLNKGETYGYDMNKGADENAAAIKAWHEWWQKDGQKLFE
jgi:hypothetical protein